MSIVSRVSLLAAAIRDKINTMMPRLIPAGGTSGQALVKASGTDFATAWQTISGGGGGGTAIHVGPTPPPAPVDGQLWLQTI